MHLLTQLSQCVNSLTLRFRHARKYLSNMEEYQCEDIQSCMALLAFPVDTGEWVAPPPLSVRADLVPGLDLPFAGSQG